MSDDARRPRWALIALLAGVGLVVVIALIAVFARGGPTLHDADTPEGVVQRYSQAVIDDDVATAMTYLVPEIADSCDRADNGTDDHRVTLLSSTQSDSTARVEVLVTTIYGSGPLGPTEYESDEVFRLVKSGDVWLIESTPWQLAVCYELQ